MFEHLHSSPGRTHQRARARAAWTLPVLALMIVGCGQAAQSRPQAGGQGTPNEAANDAATQRLAAASRRYIAEYAAAHPVTATEWGIHDHDHALRDLGAEAIAARAQQIRGLLAEVEAMAGATLDGPARHDHRLLDHALRAELLELEEVRSWQRNPMLYNDEISGGLAALVDREFAPLAERMRALIARMDAIPGVVAAARANLRDVPRVFAETGVRLAQGTLSFLRADLPATLATQGLVAVQASDAALARDFQAAHARAVAQVEGFTTWLEREVLPGARGDFRLGRALFQRKLLYEEHVDLTPEALRDMNEAAIREYHAWVAREAARIDPGKPPVEVMAALASDYPQPGALLDTARQYMAQARQYVIDRSLVTLPSDDVPVVRPTPAYARTGFASMSVPGPFEDRATAAYYNITTVDPAWDAARTHQHLTYFNRPGLLGISVHEVFPGHFVQLLYRSQLPSELRKVVNAGSLVEGWAHYTEQMMVDEGLGKGAPEVRLAQLRRALQRHARWYAGLAVHVFDVPIEEAAARFQEIAYFAAFPALRETERAAYNPTYLYYALGRMQILALRDEYRAQREARGQRFSLQEFHDRFLRLGLPPSLAREAMLADAQ
jgi:uncharacterized protein (DUF885 family)